MGKSENDQEGDITEGRPANDEIDASKAPRFEVELGSGQPIASIDGTPLHAQAGEEAATGADADADANAARLLGRSYVLSQLGNAVDWQTTLGQLGDQVAKEEIAGIRAVGEQCEVAAVAAEHVRMDSVKRKRRRKMNKHM